MFGRNEIGNPAAKPSRAHHPYTVLEEFNPDGGMWRIVGAGERDGFINAASALMADPAAFADSMRRALDEWPKSVEVCLTNPSLNHKAWLGHAGCYLAVGSPEESTRLAWHTLDAPEQWAANAAAHTVVAEWAAVHAPTAPTTMGLW